MKLTVIAILFVAFATLTAAHDVRKDPEYLRSKLNTARTGKHEETRTQEHSARVYHKKRIHEDIEGRCTDHPNWTDNEYGDDCSW